MYRLHFLMAVAVRYTTCSPRFPEAAVRDATETSTHKARDMNPFSPSMPAFPGRGTVSRTRHLRGHSGGFVGDGAAELAVHGFSALINPGPSCMVSRGADLARRAETGMEDGYRGEEDHGPEHRRRPQISIGELTRRRHRPAAPAHLQPNMGPDLRGVGRKQDVRR